MNELQKFNQNHELQLLQETRELLATIFEQGTAPNTLKAHHCGVEKFWQWASVFYLMRNVDFKSCHQVIALNFQL